MISKAHPLSVPARAHFLICYALGDDCEWDEDSSGQSAFPDLLRSAAGELGVPIRSGQSAFPDLLRSAKLTAALSKQFRPERIS